MPKINKPALVEELLLYDVFETATKAQVTSFVEDFFQLLADKVAAGDEITIPKFGKLEKYQRTNGAYKPKFTAFTDFKNAVNA